MSWPAYRPDRRIPDRRPPMPVGTGLRAGLRLGIRALTFGTLAAAASMPGARAQMARLVKEPSRPISAKKPVTFLADRVSYDRQSGVVVAEGHVQAWQNGHVLYADKVTIDRRTDTATASGHVVLMEPGGQVVFARHATLSHGMKDAVLRSVATILAENGRMVANGGRRIGGVIDELSKVVYSTCNLCKSKPTAPPLWQIRARSVIENMKTRRITYHDAELEIHGIPVFWLPVLSQADPSVRRQSGFLIPSFGSSSHVGTFFAVPYFWAIDPHEDLTIVPIVATKAGPVLDLKFRRAFNSGKLNINVSAGKDRYAAASGLSSAIFSKGVFDLNQNWRAGFTYDHTSNVQFLDDFRYLPNAAYLASNAYVEGFGRGSYARIDAQTFQGLVATISRNALPVVTPYARYAYAGRPDSLGGRFSMTANAFNIFRTLGTDSRRLAVTADYDLPFDGPDGLLFDARAKLIAAGYQASKLNEQPNYSARTSAATARAIPIGALSMRWPFLRRAGRFGEQVIEPRVQLVVAPNYGITQTQVIPNEDSLDFEFSDANLFSLSRFSGIDRYAGGPRVDYAMQGAWYLPLGATVSGLIGQSYAVHRNALYPPDSGLGDNFSDVVARLHVAPARWFGLTYRTRLSHKDLGARMIDITAGAGPDAFRLHGGYFYSSTNPYYFYSASTPPPAYFHARNEVNAGFSTTLVPHWTLSSTAARDLATGRFDYASASAVWQNECAAMNISFYRRFTSFNYDNGATTLLITVTLKTLGNIGFSAL